MVTQIIFLVASMLGTVFSTEYPVGLDPSLCPNYPFCGDSPPAPATRISSRRYPADVDPASCPNYPYCHQDVARQVPTLPLPDSSYPAGVDPSFCPNYPFCGDGPSAPVQQINLRKYPADVDPSSCPNYPYCPQDVARQVPTKYYYKQVVPLPGSAYPSGVDPSFCPNYPFCGDSPPVPVQQYLLRRYPADVDPSSCPNYPYCDEDVERQYGHSTLY